MRNASGSKRETKNIERKDARERGVFQRWSYKIPQQWRCEIPGFSGTEPHSCQGHVWSGRVRAACHQHALWATPKQLASRRRGEKGGGGGGERVAMGEKDEDRN